MAATIAAMLAKWRLSARQFASARRGWSPERPEKPDRRVERVRVNTPVTYRRGITRQNRARGSSVRTGSKFREYRRGSG